MKSLKKTAEKLCDAAISDGVKFPERWRRPMILRACSATLMLNSSPDDFDFDSALSYLKKKYSTVGGDGGAVSSDASDASAQGKNAPKKSTKTSRGLDTSKVKKARKKGAEDKGVVHGGGNKDTSKDFHPKKYEIVTVEENRPLVEAIKEMGALHFRHNEPQKGVAYMNAVKSIRQSKHRINNKKEAMALPNVGPSIAKYVDEFIKTGDVKHWEELRTSLPKK